VIGPGEAEAFARCLSVGGVAVFGADTVYGLACEPDDADAFRRLYALKGRRPDKPSAVMFFDPAVALDSLAEVGPRTRGALERLLPGPVTLLLDNPAGRFPLACGPDPGTLGVRVPALHEAAAGLSAMKRPVLQSSANHAGGAEARRLADVPADIREGADLRLDAGELPGTASTVIDLRRYERDATHVIVREGALSAADVAHTLAA
jgi:L-threonylcarbamoyladenylate synthase